MPERFERLWTLQGGTHDARSKVSESVFCSYDRADKQSCECCGRLNKPKRTLRFLRFAERMESGDHAMREIQEPVACPDNYISLLCPARLHISRIGERPMIFVVTAENRGLFDAEIDEMHRQRKIVFVERLGWKIPVVADMEIDCYDRQDTLYLIAKDRPDTEVLASARLLPTVTPHLMVDLFTGACQGAPPRGPAIWEASRFCTTPRLQHRDTRVPLLWEIICGVMETALLYGIDEVVFAANRALLPLALNCGWQARTLGPTIPDGNDEVTAAAAMITPEGLRCVRQRHGIPVPVTRLYANASACGPQGFECVGFSESAPILHTDRRIGRF